MNKSFFTIALIFSSLSFYSQGGVAVNNTGTAPNTNAMLDVSSDDKGILIPRLTTASRTTLGGTMGLPENGMLVYDKDLLVFYYWDGTQWVLVGNGIGSDDQNISGSGLSGTTLTIGIEGGTSETVDLSPLQDGTGTDNQDLSLTGDILSLTNDGTTVDLSTIKDHDWYEVGGTNQADAITDDIFTLGNVGIGIANPGAKLHTNGGIVIADNDNSFSIFYARSSGLAGANTYGSYFIGAGNRGTIASPQAVQTGDVMAAFEGRTGLTANYGTGFRVISSETQSAAAAGSEIQFYTKPNGSSDATVPTDRMVIKNDGNVGIGTNSPTRKLQIGDVAGVSDALQDGIVIVDPDGPTIRMRASGTSEYFIESASGTGNQLFFKPGNLTNTATLSLVSNNVGIGNETPTNKLSIGANLGSGYAITANSGTPYGQVIETFEATPSANAALWVRNNDGSNTNTILTVQNRGRVGINTLTPTDELEVQGSVKIVDGTQGAGKVLTSDATGKASWQIGGVPAGAIMAFDLATCPTGWAAADGSGGTPDLRGEFVRGLDNGRGVDVGRVLGSMQSDEITSHNHSVDPPITSTSSDGQHDHTINNQSSNEQQFIAFSRNDINPSITNDGTSYHSGSGSAPGNDRIMNINPSGNHTHSVNIPAFNSAANGGTETRPRNVALLYCKKQ